MNGNETYKFDTHIHTSEVSTCANMGVEETVRRYHAAGYSGICSTDHLVDCILVDFGATCWRFRLC